MKLNLNTILQRKHLIFAVVNLACRGQHCVGHSVQWKWVTTAQGTSHPHTHPTNSTISVRLGWHPFCQTARLRKRSGQEKINHLFILFWFNSKVPMRASFSFYILPFQDQQQQIHYQLQLYELKQIVDRFVWDSNPGPQDGRPRRIHWEFHFIKAKSESEEGQCLCFIWQSSRFQYLRSVVQIHSSAKFYNERGCC